MPQPTAVLLMARELGLGGTERQLTEIAKALDRSRFEPHVGCFRPEGLRGEELRAAGVPVARFPASSLYSPGALAAALRMARYLASRRIQLVHTFDVPMNLFGVPAARAFRTPVVISSQRAYRTLTPGIHRHLLRVTDQIVDAIVVNCQAMRTHLIEDEHVSSDRIHVCYNGIDIREFQPAPRCPVPGASLAIGVVCALRPEKDLESLLDAFAKLKAPGVKLVIVGSGPWLPVLESRSRALGIAAQCHFEPATKRVAAWLHKIDIFVLPSRSEALSNSLMEAMACGCAAVASRVGGNVELVKEGHTGLTFNSGDARQLAAILQLLIENEALRNELAVNGSRFIREHFSLQSSAARMAEIYSNLLEHRH